MQFTRTDAGLRRCGSFTLLCAIFLATAVHGQNSTGTLRGVVQDSSGARIPSATVVAQAVGSSLKREIKSDDHGEFRLNELLPGKYRVVVNAQGFAEASSDVTVIVSSVRDVAVTLKLIAPRETVNVQARPSSITTQPIDLASVVHQGAVSEHDLETIPLAHRSFANIAYLVPGTMPRERPAKSR